MNTIKYKKRVRYKYTLSEEYECLIGFEIPHDIVTAYASIQTTGRLAIRKSYAWDGPSGPTIDTKNFMRGSLVHDALYQMMREGHLDAEQYRDAADQLLRKMCIQDGMSRIRAWWVYWGVRLFARRCTESDLRVAP